MVGLTRESMSELAKDISKLDKSMVHSAIHQRNAQRLTRMCAQNGGIYIKLGQHLSMLDHILPMEYHDELCTLLHATPISSAESVRRIMKQDFGAYPEQLFAQFDIKPIASASLGQVHIAKDSKGRKYAVKVQHEGLAESSSVDRLVISFLVDKIHFFFPNVDYRWLTKEMNKNLPKELDFYSERSNLNRCKQLLKTMVDRGEVVIPTVYDDFSSHRVLTMSFEEGFFVHDKTKLVDSKLNPSEISFLISKIFCEQIFRHGFVHCGTYIQSIYCAMLCLKSTPNEFQT